jgi:PhoH-like ATPase
MKKQKTFILDTSVLLYDCHSIHTLAGHKVIIPIVVLDELDRFKDRQALIGENARYINRYLDGLRAKGNINKGVKLENGQTIRVELNCYDDLIPDGLETDYGDNKILGVAKYIQENEDKDVIVITKDINFRVKCDALGIAAEDYYRDRIVKETSEIFTGQVLITDFDNSIVDEFFSDGFIEADEFENEFLPNQFVVLKSKSRKQSCICRYDHLSDRLVKVEEFLNRTIDVNARNKEQKFALNLLTRDDVPLVTLSGLAGSGKTFLTLMAGLSGISDKRYERIVITRSIQPVGKEIGFLPGDINEKMDPWLAPIVDNFRQAFNDLSYFEMMRKKGQFEVAPLSYIRGRTFANTFFIVDEAQNLTVHELKTIVTRIGEGSKIILLGDLEQIDTPYIDTLSNGLTVFIEKMKSSHLSGHITLQKGERSELATAISKLI